MGKNIIIHLLDSLHQLSKLDKGARFEKREWFKNNFKKYYKKPFEFVRRGVGALWRLKTAHLHPKNTSENRGWSVLDFKGAPFTL